MGSPRIMVFDRLDRYLCDIDPTAILDATYVEEINGENSLTVTTTQALEKTNRLLVRDNTGEWHEYVVLGVDESHEHAVGTVKTYYCVWSLQYDLMCTFINGPYDCGIVPGHASIPQLPNTAMGVALGGTSRWEVGTITVTTMAAASFYRRSGWEGLQTVIEKWGGELHATIEVGAGGVVSRKADLLAHFGSETAARRFDYGHDVTSIRRTVPDDIWPCRIVPLGKSQETEAGGYTRRPSIESVNDGCMWLQDDEAAPLVRTLDPNGNYEYPTLIVLNDTYEQPADLKAWATAHISEYTRPKVTYRAGVMQLEEVGLSARGVSLGDNVAVVDRGFGTDGLRIDARVVRVEGSLLDGTDTTLTIGNATEGLSGQLSGLSRQVEQVSEVVSRSQQFQATAEYVSNLISRLNGEANATGGYTYITEGEGLRTYDYPVSDPAVGAEATQVVEIRGGNIRIANSRTSGGDWDWKTVLVSGHIAASLVTAASIVAGYIGNASTGAYWNLDSNSFRMGGSDTIGDRTVSQALAGIDATITDVDVEYAESQSNQTAPQSGWSTTAPAWREGYYIWSRTAVTTAGGTTYSDATCISGRDGIDGTDGTDGVGISSTTITYGKSASATTEPSSWGSSVPTLAKGDWLWVKTVYAYTDSSSKTTYTKSYIGTDGEDGTSVFVQSATKTDGTTTVVIADSEGNTNTLTIVDGEDGEDGHPGTNGLNGYVHTAWANSADGSQDFSTSVSTGKSYLGTYTDNTQADSQTYTDYSWTLIKGLDGQPGADGVGISSIVEQYYQSTSPAEPTGGEWTEEQPVWSSGTYIWTRSIVTWDDGTTTPTDPVLANALNDMGERTVENSAAIGELSGDVGTIADTLSSEVTLREQGESELADSIGDLEESLEASGAALRALVEEARRTATDYIAYENGELTLGTAGSVIRNVMTATTQTFRTSAGDVAWFGLNANGIWEMFIQTASVRDRLSFGDFSWIARQNGNMTLKWEG